MSVQFLAFLFFIYAAITFIGGMYDDATTDASTLSTLLQFQIFREAGSTLFGFDFSFPVPNGSWFRALGTMVTWNYSLFEGGIAALIKVLFLGSLGFAVVGTFLTNLFGNRLSRAGL